MKRICDFISRYMGVIVLLTAVVSLLLPASFVWVDTVYINPLLGLVMFVFGAAVSPLVGLGGSALWPMGLLIALSNGAALFCGWRALQRSRNIIKAKEERIVKK